MVSQKRNHFFYYFCCINKVKIMAKNQYSYSEAYSKLQEILSQIENNQLDVDELSSKIKEASSLLKICKDKLFVANEETKKIIDNIA